MPYDNWRRGGLAALLAVGTSVGAAGCGSDEVIYVDVGDAQLRVHVKGDPDADTLLLVLHGGPANDSSLLERGRAAARLEDHYRVAYLDQRGMGGSWGRLDDDQLTVQQWARDGAVVVQVLQELYAPEQLWLYGHSWGGMLGTLMLLDTDARDRVDGWIEVAGCHDGTVLVEESVAAFEVRAPEQIAAGSEYAPQWQQALDVVTALPEAPLSLEDWLVLTEYNAEANGWLESLTAKTEEYAYIGHLLVRGNESYTGWLPSAQKVANGLVEYQHGVETEERLGEIEVPSLFVYATQDFVCPPGLGRRAQARVGSSRSAFVELSRSGHLPMFDEPDALADAVISFVDEEAPR